MSFVTYVLVSGFLLGTNNEFSPEKLGLQASSALAWLLMEVLLILMALYLLSISSCLGFFHLLAFSSYKFVPYVDWNPIVVHFSFPTLTLSLSSILPLFSFFFFFLFLAVFKVIFNCYNSIYNLFVLTLEELIISSKISDPIFTFLIFSFLFSPSTP